MCVYCIDEERSKQKSTLVKHRVLHFPKANAILNIELQNSSISISTVNYYRHCTPTNKISPSTCFSSITNHQNPQMVEGLCREKLQITFSKSSMQLNNSKHIRMDNQNQKLIIPYFRI